MKLWRISNYANLDGEGGRQFSARWHSKGRAVIYAAEHPAGSLVELLVHTDISLVPETFQLLTIEIDHAATPAIVDQGALPDKWKDDAAATRPVGDAWLAGATSLLLRVPSAILPDVWNILINLTHADAKTMRIVKKEKVPLDSRLTRR